ncbi:MAG: hypothetical protein WBZ48_09775 [Bacteroidota bacterium]
MKREFSSDLFTRRQIFEDENIEGQRKEGNGRRAVGTGIDTGNDRWRHHEKRISGAVCIGWQSSSFFALRQETGDAAL